MFPLDQMVQIHRRNGEVEQFLLLEQQRGRYLVVLPPDVADEAAAYVDLGGTCNDELVQLLIKHVRVVDGEFGTPLTAKRAQTVLERSDLPAVRRAALWRTPMAEKAPSIAADDIAYAFGL